MITPLERMTRALSHEEADRVPYMLSVMLHGPALLGMSFEEYFGEPEAVAEAQVALQRRYGHDAILALYFAAMEHEAWGGQVRFFDDGPPNAGAPLVRDIERIPELRAPAVEECPRLQKMLQSIRRMRQEAPEVMIVGAVVAPNSVPVMQLGFEAYLHVVLERRDLYWQLMERNEPFAVAWANAQVEAGASVVAYFDPVASPTVMPPAVYRETGFQVARRVFPQIRAGVGVGLASGRSIPILDDLAEAGAGAVGVSADDDLAVAKARAGKRLALMGNLNGIAMRRWDAAQAAEAVRSAIAAAGPGGGFLLAEHHGEIPPSVPDDTLRALADAVHRYGTYPIAVGDG